MSAFADHGLLRAFVAIVESGCISAAARRLRTTQPTLSRQLRALEERCGVTLLRRDTHRMSLTDSGHTFLADARVLLAMAEEAELRLRGEQGTLQGPLKVFATIDFGQSVVSRLVASFLQANAAVTIDLAYSNRPLHMIEEGCDVGIIAGTLTDEAVIARRAGRIVRYPVASAEFLRARSAPREPGDLAGWPWLALASSRFGGPREETFWSQKGRRRVRIKPVLISEGVTSLREAARAGLGVAVLPEWLIGEDLISGRLQRVLPAWQARDLSASIVYPVQRRLPARVRAFVEYAAAYMATCLKGDGPDGLR